MVYRELDEDECPFPNWSAERTFDPERYVVATRKSLQSEREMLSRIERMQVEEMKLTMNNCFYLRGCPIPLRAYEGDPMPTSTRFVSITGLPGSGKHDIETIIAETIVQEEHQQRVIIGSTPNMAAATIKHQYQTNEPGGQLNAEWIGISMVSYFAYLREIRESSPNHAIGYRGPLGIWNSLMLFFGQPEFASLLSDPAISKTVWKTPDCQQLANSQPELIDRVWVTMLRVWQDGQQQDKFPWSQWPMVAQPSPIIMISDLSPEKCWQLQERPNAHRESPRPFGPHPFSKEQVMIMRLVHAAMVRDLDFVTTFGGFDPDYNNGGAQRLAQEMMQKSYQLYRRFKR